MNASKLTELVPRLAVRAFFVACSAAVLSGCHQDMWNQPRYTALQGNDFFPDGRSARPRVPGTVDYQNALRKWIDPVAYAGISEAKTVPPVTDDRFWTGREGEGFVADNYFEVSKPLLERGRERYNVTCMPCHGAAGDGTGIITMRGFPVPPSYHIDRLREVEDGYIFDVITNGFGRMYSYASRVKPEDRWAIAAYIRALQTSQNIDVSDKDALLAREVQQEIAAQDKAAAEAAKEKAGYGHGHDTGHGDAGHDADSHGADEEDHG